MPNSSQRAGRLWEEDAARELRDGGHPKADTARVRHPDRGDIDGVEDWTVECKAIAPSSSPATCPAAFKAWALAHPGSAVPQATQRAAFLAGWAAGQAAIPRFDMAAAMDQATAAQARKGTPYAVVLRKRRGKPAAQGFAMMPLAMWSAIARRLAEEPEPEVRADAPF